MKAQYSLTEIVSRLGGELVGDGDIVISRVASLANAQAGHISFITDSKYRTQLADTAASAIIISEQHRALTTLPRIVKNIEAPNFMTSSWTYDLQGKRSPRNLNNPSSTGRSRFDGEARTQFTNSCNVDEREGAGLGKQNGFLSAAICSRSSTAP